MSDSEHKKDFGDTLGLNDFETNAFYFLAAVEGQIQGKYPDLEVEALNVTAGATEDLDHDFVDWLRENWGQREVDNYLNTRKNADRQSATQNTVDVSIHGENDKRVMSAKNDCDSLATKFHGVSDPTRGQLRDQASQIMEDGRSLLDHVGTTRYVAEPSYVFRRQQK